MERLFTTFKLAAFVFAGIVHAQPQGVSLATSEGQVAVQNANHALNEGLRAGYVLGNGTIQVIDLSSNQIELIQNALCNSRAEALKDLSRLELGLGHPHEALLNQAQANLRNMDCFEGNRKITTIDSYNAKVTAMLVANASLQAILGKQN